MNTIRPKIDLAAYVCTEDRRAILRLTEQANAVLKTAQALPKAAVQVQKAQEICEDIRKILKNTDELAICSLFEGAIAPRLVRLAQELKMKKTLSKMGPKTIKQMVSQPMPSQHAHFSAKKNLNPDQGAKIVHNILQELRDILK